MIPETDDFKYIAFISFRHVKNDRAWAKWLHRNLESFKVPKKLVQKGYPKRLGRVFRDEEELAATASLPQEICEVLEVSKYLIVICSPEAARSRWVREEIINFTRLRDERNIFTFLIEGEPSESFPMELARSSEHTPINPSTRFDRLGGDVRPKSGEWQITRKRHALLRIVSGLLECDFDELRQRENERRRNQRVVFSSVLFLVIGLLAAILVFAFFQNQQARFQAKLARIETSSRLASSAEAAIQSSPHAALLLGVHSIRATKSDEFVNPLSQAVLIRALRRSGGRLVGTLPVSNLSSAVISNDLSHVAASVGKEVFIFSRLENSNQTFELSEDPNAMCFVPNSNFLILGDESGMITFIDINSKSRPDVIRHRFRDNIQIRYLACSPNGKWLLVAGRNSVVYLVPLTEDFNAFKKSKRIVIESDAKEVFPVFSNDSKWLAVPLKEKIALYDLTKTLQSNSPLKYFQQRFPGYRLVFGEGLVADYDTRERLARDPDHLLGYSTQLTGLCFSMDDLKLFCGDENGRVSYFDLQTLAETKIAQLPYKIDRLQPISPIAISATVRPAIKSDVGMAYPITIIRLKENLKSTIAHGNTERVKLCWESHDQTRFFSLDKHGALRIWNMEDLQNKTGNFSESIAVCSGVVMAAGIGTWRDSNELIVINSSGEIRCVDLDAPLINPQLVRPRQSQKPKITLLAANDSHDARPVIAFVGETFVEVADIDGDILPINLPNTDLVSAGELSPNGKLLVIGTLKGEVFAWLHDGTNNVFKSLNIAEKHAEAINDVAVTADCRLIASGSGTAFPGIVRNETCDNSVSVYDGKSGSRLRVKKMGDYKISRLNFSKDGKHLACGLSDGNVEILKADDLETVLRFSVGEHCTALSWSGSVCIAAGNSLVAADTKTGRIGKPFVFNNRLFCDVDISNNKSGVFTTQNSVGAFVLNDDLTVGLVKIAEKRSPLASCFLPASISLDGDVLAAGFDDGEVLLGLRNANNNNDNQITWNRNQVFLTPGVDSQHFQLGGVLAKDIQVYGNCGVVLVTTDSGCEIIRLRPIDLVDLVFHSVGRNFTFNEWKKFFPGENYERTFDQIPVGTDVIVGLTNQAVSEWPNRTKCREKFAVVEGFLEIRHGSQLFYYVALFSALYGAEEIALRLASIAFELSPEDPPIQDTYALALVLNDDYQKSAILFRQASVRMVNERNSESFDHDLDRNRWADLLERGENPLTKDILDKLREQHPVRSD